jgi:hypothetical protein
MSDRIVSHSNPYEQLSPAEIDEFNAWIDETTKEITSEELRSMSRRDQASQQALYQQAKAKFSTLHVFSQPDSLTRRGTTLIARRRLTIEQALNGAVADWRQTITTLFNSRVTIDSISIDQQLNLRVRFTPHSLVKLSNGSYCLGNPDEKAWLSWCASRNGGGY